MSEKAVGTAEGEAARAAARSAPWTARSAVVWEALRELLAELAERGSRGAGPLRIVDAGGGTGGAAVPLAALGHEVTVVEPSPDSLAALERRAADGGVRVRGLQGDTRDLASLLPAGDADLVLVHNVLEYVEDPRAALADVAAAVAPGGAVSVLAANAAAAALHRVLQGGVAEAHRMLRDPQGRWGEADPMPRRFTAEGLAALAAAVGLEGPRVRGVGVFSDLLPGRAYDAGTVQEEELTDLEREASSRPELAGIATQLHVVAHRPES